MRPKSRRVYRNQPAQSSHRQTVGGSGFSE